MVRQNIGAGCAALIAAAAALGSASTASAAPLNLALSKPDVYSDTIQISYTVTDPGNSIGTLTATGKARTLKPVVGPNITLTSPAAGSFALTALLKFSGPGVNDPVQIVSGTLSVSGDQGAGVQTLLSSATLSSFGFSNTAADFEFLFSNGSGVLDPAGAPIGVKLHANGLISNASFTNDFFAGSFGPMTVAAGTADAFVVPEPASLAVLAVGAAALITRRRRKHD